MRHTLTEALMNLHSITNIIIYLQQSSYTVTHCSTVHSHHKAHRTNTQHTTLHSMLFTINTADKINSWKILHGNWSTVINNLSHFKFTGISGFSFMTSVNVMSVTPSVSVKYHKPITLQEIFHPKLKIFLPWLP